MKLIYYADDDIDDLNLFQYAVSSTDVTVVLFFSGQALLDALKEENQKPDIIFVDQQMPITLGEEVVTTIRSHEQYNPIPVVIVTGYAHSNQIQRFLELGVNYIMKKESSLFTFKATLHQILEIDWSRYKPNLDEFVF